MAAAPTEGPPPGRCRASAPGARAAVGCRSRSGLDVGPGLLGSGLWDGGRPLGPGLGRAGVGAGAGRAAGGRGRLREKSSNSAACSSRRSASAVGMVWAAWVGAFLAGNCWCREGWPGREKWATQSQQTGRRWGGFLTRGLARSSVGNAPGGGHGAAGQRQREEVGEVGAALRGLGARRGVLPQPPGDVAGGYGAEVEGPVARQWGRGHPCREGAHWRRSEATQSGGRSAAG